MGRSKKSRAASRRGGVRFEKRASQIIFDPVARAYVVTWVKCSRPDEERLAAAKDPLRWKPSISAVVALHDRGRIPSNRTVYAARSIRDAWRSGDRDMLDTEGAKRAAELVSDLSVMSENSSGAPSAEDLGQALRTLADEMAAVRFSDAPLSDFSDAVVMPPLEKAVKECMRLEGFADWPSQSRRRRFLYCLSRRERSQVAYTLASLLFDAGACPLLTACDRRALRMMCAVSSGICGGSTSVMTQETALKFFRDALGKMRDMKEKGLSRMREGLTQQQLADSISEECKL